jgi:hypothetical protein
MFRHLLTNYFFKQEVSQGKSIELIFNNLPLPDFLKKKKSLLEVTSEEIRDYVEGTVINDSLGGKVLLSAPYLKVFYPHHMPSFNKLPEDVRFELLDKIKEKNSNIIAAYNKMNLDKEADRKRKILTLVAIILKNVCRKSGRPVANIESSVEESIRKIFRNTDEVFNGSQRQYAELSDDTKIKDFIKTFFVVRQFKEINELAGIYKDELSRFRKRGLKIGTM